MPFPLVINGQYHDFSSVPAHLSLLDFLRQKGMTGTKCGCNEGDCGACTVLLLENQGPPRAINSCLALMHSLAGREVVTSEGLLFEGELHPAQEAMITKNGSQCGYCTPGIVCSMAEACARGVTDDETLVADQLCGNLCRCTGYRPIAEASQSLRRVDLVPAEEPKEPGSNLYLAPNSLAEFFKDRDLFPDAPLIAGATELAVLVNKQGWRPERFISLEHVEELHEMSCDEQFWHLGAGVAMTDIEKEMAGDIPILDELWSLFASRQIRHRATLGGNLATASPIGDSAPVLLALDARLNLASKLGQREVALADFFTGYRKTQLLKDELIVSVKIPRKLKGRSQFFKVSKRREMDIATVSAAIRLVTDQAGRITEARLAYGGVAATPVRALKTEKSLIGLTLKAAAKLGEELQLEFQPLSDHRGSADYRRVLVKDLFLKYLANEEVESPSRNAQFSPETEVHFPHESAYGHVTGGALYTHDLALKRQPLHLWPVRAEVSHGRLTALDVSKAEQSPGVWSVLTAESVPGHNNTGTALDDEPLFAEETIFFKGQLVAAIVADSVEAAIQAAKLVEMEVVALPPLLGIKNAIEAECYHTEPHVLARGDVKQALSQAPRTLKGELSIGGQEHFYLETHAAFAEPDGEGGFKVTSSTQHPSETQTIVAEVMGVSRNQIVVECPRMGGGFGSKETQANPWAALCTLAAQQTGQGVAVQLDRDIDIEMTGKRHPFLANYEVGFDEEGRLLAASVQLWSDGGWSLDLSLPVNDRALFHLDNAYYIPNVRFEGRVCQTNVTSHTAFRGFGGPQGMVVIEEILSLVAAELSLPAHEVRAKNLYHGRGETNCTHYGEDLGDNRIGRIWEQLMESSEFEKRKDEIKKWNDSHRNRKRGLAITPVKFGISFTLKHYNQAGALVLIYADGSVQVNHGGTEMGQGLHTKMLAVAVRELGLSSERIRVMHTRTDKVPNTSATAASSGSDLNGMAVADACGKLKRRLARWIAPELDCGEKEVRFRDGWVLGGSKRMSFEELIAKAYEARVSLSATGFYKTPNLKWDWSEPNPKGKPFHYYAFGGAVSEVEVDGFTGMSRILRTDILQDVGDSLNPEIDRGQIEGGFVQGAGWLTCEELLWSPNGDLQTHSASSYAIPAFSDAPYDLRVSLLENASQDRTIHGSKAVGEPPFMLAISVREALRDAIFAFGGTDLSLSSPLTSEVVKSAIGPLK